MSWGFRFDIPEQAKAEGIKAAARFNGRAANSGKDIPVLIRKNGVPSWAIARYGLMLRLGASARFLWNARRESLQTNENWTRLIGQRVAIPVNAYVENAPSRSWNTGTRGWVPGLFDQSYDGGVVAITEAHGSEGGSPIILTQAAAMAWLDSEPWNAIARLDGERVHFEQADVFTAAALDRELQSRVPIAA